MRDAKHSIYMQIYSLTDPDLKELLKSKSQQGIAVTIFYDQKASPNLQSELSPFGIAAYPALCSGLMHRKIFVIDEEIVYLGSANLTTASLKMHDNVLLGIWHPELAHFCLSSSEPVGKFTVGDQQLQFFFLPEARIAALDCLLHYLKGAEKSIDAALFTLTHPAILNELIEAHKRSIEVNIAIDYYSKRGASRTAVESLQKNGISVVASLGQQLLHHKWALIDKEHLILGSANWTQSAFRNNQDFVILVTPLKRPNKRSFEKMWHTLRKESL